MIVSRGIGNSIFPFRINNRPELVVIKLNSKLKFDIDTMELVEE